MTSKRLTCAALLLAGSSLLLATPSFAQTPPPHGHPPPHGGPPGGHGHGGAPHFAFHAHDFAHFSVGERSAWLGGRWDHGWHNGRLGWWWYAGGAWYFYGAPIYPYPGYVSDDYVDDDAYGPPGQNWYYCQNPPGYYPYVQQCRMPWQPVPPRRLRAAATALNRDRDRVTTDLRRATALRDPDRATTAPRRAPITARQTSSRLPAIKVVQAPAISLHRAIRALRRATKARDNRVRARAIRDRRVIRPAIRIRARRRAPDRGICLRRRLTIDS